MVSVLKEHSKSYSLGDNTNNYLDYWHSPEMGEKTLDMEARSGFHGNAETHTYMPRHLSAKWSHYWEGHHSKATFGNLESPSNQRNVRIRTKSEDDGKVLIHVTDENGMSKSNKSKHRNRSHGHHELNPDQSDLRLSTHADVSSQSESRTQSHDHDKDRSDRSKRRTKSHERKHKNVDQSEPRISSREETKSDQSEQRMITHVVNYDFDQKTKPVTPTANQSELVSDKLRGTHQRERVRHRSSDAKLQDDESTDTRFIETDLAKLRKEKQKKAKEIEGSVSQKGKPPMLRNATMPEIPISEFSPEKSESNVLEDPRKFLRTEALPQRTSRRSMSDLGFRKVSPGLKRSNSRTLLLLQNPVLRKSLARTMKLDPSKENFDDEVYNKLSSKAEESFDQSFSLSESFSSGRGGRLCCSTSDLGLLRDLEPEFQNTRRINRSVQDDHDVDSVKFRRQRESSKDKSCDTESPDISQSESSKQSHDSSLPPSLKTSPRSLSASQTVSSFKIPSYKEFKAVRGKSRFMSKSTANLASIVPTIFEEDSYPNSQNGDGTNSINVSNVNKKLGFAIINTTDDSSLDDVFQKPSEEAPPKPKPRRKKQRRRTENSEHRDTQQTASPHHRSSSTNAFDEFHDLEKVKDNSRSLDCHSDEENVISPPSTTHHRKSHQHSNKSKLQNVSNCDEISSHHPAKSVSKNSTKHRKSLFKRSQSDNLLKQESSQPSQNTVFSDYVSDSNAELSDNLEDVLLKPMDKPSEATISMSDVKFSLKDHLKGSCLSKKEELSDSGCLVEQRSFDLDSVSELKSVDESGTMPRSTSDVSDMFAEEQRTKTTRERRNKLYKSDPLNTGECKVRHKHFYGHHPLRRQDSKEDILEFLEMKSMETSSSSSISGSQGKVSHSHSSEKHRKHKHDKTRQKRITSKPPSGRKKLSSSIEIEHSCSKDMSEKSTEKVTICEDCAELICHSPGGSSGVDEYTVCTSCKQRRRQRKEAILEIVETEQNYGNDLAIINDHFYERIQTTGLLTPEQMQAIFINLQELITVNQYFSTQLRNSLDLATANTDQFLRSVHIGKLFLESSNMLLAYESYCINQSSAPILLDQLLEEKNLLRILLEVTQREKSVLRKMDLKAFLMVPVQRVMKYPLLLGRLHKVTLPAHPDHDNILQAQKKIENILELINSKTKGSASTKLRRRLSLRRSQEFDSSVFENIEMHKVAMEVLGWDRSNLHFQHTGKLQCAQVMENISGRRGKIVKYTQVHGLLVTLGKILKPDKSPRSSILPNTSGVESAALVLVKEKAGRPQPFRDPLLLRQCVVCRDPDNADVIELHEANKDSLLLKCEKVEDTQAWYKQLCLLIRDLSQWRHRRKAQANIMLQDF